MHTKKRLSILAVALSTSLAACDGSLPTEPTSGLETGEAALSLARLTTPPVVIGFESLVGETGDDLRIALHKEAEFTLTNAIGFRIVNPSDPFFFRGSTTLIPSINDETVVGETRTDLYKDDDGAFNVASIDITEVAFFGAVPIYITFTGVKADESDPVMETFMTDGDGLQTLLFPASFTNLSSLSWVQTGGPLFLGPLYQFDNITITFSSDSSDPQTRGDCMKGDWRDFGFRNQGQCVRFVEKNENGKDKER